MAAVSSGGSRGHGGRRREVVRQRTATRAAKTVGSYVEPPQRTAIAALLLHVWGNLKRLVSASARVSGRGGGGLSDYGGVWSRQRSTAWNEVIPFYLSCHEKVSGCG